MKTTDIVRERTPEEKESFVEGFDCCIATITTLLSQGMTAQESVSTAKRTAQLIKTTIAEGGV